VEEVASAPTRAPGADAQGRSPVASLADRLAIGWGVVVAAVVLVALVVLFAAVRRGLDLTDESDYILSELHAGAYLRSSTQFQLLLGPMLSLVGHVWVLRVVKLAGLVAAHAFFAWCFLTTAPALIGAHFKRSDQLAVGAAIVAGGFGLSRTAPQTPGYNDLTTFFVVVVAGLLLLLAARRFAGRAELAAWFVAGLLAYLQLLSRWPSATAFLPLLAIAFFWSGGRAADMVRRGAAGLAGVALGAVVTQLFLASIPDIVRGIHQGNNDADVALGYSRTHLLHQYVTNVSDLARVMSKSFWFLLAAAVVVGVALGIRRLALPAAVAGAAGLVALTPAFVASGRAHGGVEPFGGVGLPLLLARSVPLPLYVSLAILAGVAALLVRRERVPLRSAAIIVALLIAPFLGALGSNNPLWYNAGLNPALYIAGAFALLSLAHVDYGRLLVHGLAFACATLLAFTAYDGTWRRPYRQVPLAQATVALHVHGPLDGLRLDGPTAAFLEQIRAIADSVRSSPPPYFVVWAGINPYTALGLPGASVAADLDQPVFAWLSASFYADKSLAAACTDHTRGILLLGNIGQSPDPSADPALASCVGRTFTTRASLTGYEVLYAGPVA